MVYMSELLVEREVMQMDLPECVDELWIRIGEAITHLAQIEPGYQHFVFVRVGEI